MPTGYLWAVAIVAVYTLAALWPLALAVLTVLGLVEVAGEGRSPAGGERSLDRDLGGWRSVCAPRRSTRRRWTRILLAPFPLWSREVQRIRTSATATGGGATGSTCSGRARVRRAAARC